MQEVVVNKELLEQTAADSLSDDKSWLSRAFTSQQLYLGVGNLFGCLIPQAADTLCIINAL